MDAELRHRLKYELRLLTDFRDKYARRLEARHGLENLCIRATKHRNGKVYCYVKKRGAKKYKYAGSRECPDVKRICEAHFLREAIRRIDINIALIRHLIENYLDFDPGSVNSSLREVLRCDVPPVSEAYQAAAAKWKKEMLVYQASFPENYPENKTETTSDKVKVKTLSEVVLYERFKAAGLCQIYELPLVLKDYGPAIYPDFSILSPIDMKTVIYVEYAGRLDLPEYQKAFARKVDRYIANGYIPGVNVFFIFGDRKGRIDSTQINKVIADIRGL